MLIGLTGLCGCGSSSYTEKDTAGITKEAQEQKKTVAESVESDDSTKAKTKEQETNLSETQSSMIRYLTWNRSGNRQIIYS